MAKLNEYTRTIHAFNGAFRQSTRLHEGYTVSTNLVWNNRIFVNANVCFLIETILLTILYIDVVYTTYVDTCVTP